MGKHKVTENIMPKVNGVSFRCECGCNVFHHPEKVPPRYNRDLTYQCNCCGEWYVGEK